MDDDNRTDKELIEFLDTLISRNKTDQHTVLSRSELKRMRYLEWRNKRYTRNFRDDFKSIDLDGIISMRHDRLMTDTEISRVTGLLRSTVHSIIGFFNIQVDDDRQDEYFRHRKEAARESQKNKPPRKQTPEEKAKRKATYRRMKESGEMDRIVRKREKTFIRKYGATTPMHVKAIKDKISKTNIDRYGSASPMGNKDIRRKAAHTLHERYGVDHSSFESSKIQDKARKTVNERYGGSGPGSPEIRERIIATNLRNHGVKWATQIPEARMKAVESYQKRYGVDNPFKADEVKQRIYDTLMDEYGRGYAQQIPQIREKTFKAIHNSKKTRPRISMLNRSVADAIRKSIPGCEISYEPPIGTVGNADIEVTYHGRKAIIDINPTVTHNSYRPFACVLCGCGDDCTNLEHKAITQDYHYRRSAEAMRNGLEYGQFYQWNSLNDIIEWTATELADYTESYPAGDLNMATITSREANRFLGSAHLQGRAGGQSACYALTDDAGRTLAVATFRHPEHDQSYDMEWIRYDTRPGIRICGAPERMLRQALADNPSVQTVIGSIDFNHNTLRKTILDDCGFHGNRLTGPKLVWARCDSRKIIAGEDVAKHGAHRILGISASRYEDSRENDYNVMIREGWLPVYTSGDRIYSYHRQ